MTEFVKIKAPEIVYGETNLLQSQLNLLNLLKQYQEYERLRKEEIFLKIDLKKKIGEASEFLEQLNKILPESKFMEEEEKKENMKRELAEKIERAVQSSKNKEWKYWTEEETTSKEEVVSKKPEGVLQKKEPKSSLDQELEDIRKKLEKLQ